MDNNFTDPGARASDGHLTVFFDGGCPLCRREIAFYRRRRGAERVRWVDLKAAGERSLPPGLTRQAALARMHVQLADGRLVDGAPAFLAMWRALPAFRPAAWLLDRRWLHGPLELGYRLFLRWRPALQRLAGAGGDRAPEGAASRCEARGR